MALCDWSSDVCSSDLLGLFAFQECYQFEEIWKRREEDPLTLHRVIWYQFMFHVDKYIEVPEILNSWAIDITRPYLSCIDPQSLDMDTITPWNDMKFTTPMEEESNDDWTQVTGKRRNRSPPKQIASLDSISKLTPLRRSPPRKMHELPLKPGTDPSLAARRDWNHYKKLVKPAAKEPSMKTVTETEEDIVITAEDGTMEDLTMASRDAVSFAESVQLPRPPPFPNVSVNDGTHRVKIKWSVPINGPFQTNSINLSVIQVSRAKQSTVSCRPCFKTTTDLCIVGNVTICSSQHCRLPCLVLKCESIYLQQSPKFVPILCSSLACVSVLRRIQSSGRCQRLQRRS